jgi:hypothetical protein
MEEKKEIDYSFSSAKDFKLNPNNSFEIKDLGKPGFISYGKSRIYKLSFKTENSEYIVERGYSEIRTFYKKICIEFPYLILPHLFSKKEDPKDEERVENIKEFFVVLVKYSVIVSSTFFEAFVNSSQKQDQIWKDLSSELIDFQIFHKKKKTYNDFLLL